MVRVFNAEAVSINQINNKSVVPLNATVGWRCWGESIRFIHTRGGARTQWCVFPTLWQGPLTRSTTKQSSHTAPWLTGHAGVCRFASITHVDERGHSGARFQCHSGDH